MNNIFLDFGPRGFFDLSFFTRNRPNVMRPNFYDFSVVEQIINDYLNSDVPHQHVEESTFQRETKPVKVGEILNCDGGADCSICFDKIVASDSEINSLSKDELKILKDRFEIKSVDLDEIKSELHNIFNNKDFEIKDSIITKKCKHCFHKKCIEQWFKDHNTCPLCRYEFKNDNNDNNNNF